MLASVERLVRQFLADAASPSEMFYNEAALQHELALFLRATLPKGWRLYIECAASRFRPSATALTKKEIDLAVADSALKDVVAIELKCPRQGQYPEQMYKACQDLRFLEQLVENGFSAGLFVLHVDDPLFYKQDESPTGIYRYFRGGVPICGTIAKPTGTGGLSVTLSGSYVLGWTPSEGKHRYWVQPVCPPVT